MIQYDFQITAREKDSLSFPLKVYRGETVVPASEYTAKLYLSGTEYTFENSGTDSKSVFISSENNKLINGYYTVYIKLIFGQKEKTLCGKLSIKQGKIGGQG